MRLNSLHSLVFASVASLIFAASSVAQTTYSVVSPAPASSATITAPTAVAPTAKPAKPELTTFAPSNETLNATSYQAMFRTDAFTVLDQVAAIESRKGKPALAADEASLFQDVRGGRADHFTLAEAALIASGVHSAAQRQKYLAQIDEITAGAQAAVANHTTIKTKSRILAKYLLDGPMKAGYDGDQYLLSNLLDTGHYNCLSSAMLFNIVAHRLDIPVAAVERTDEASR